MASKKNKPRGEITIKNSVHLDGEPLAAWDTAVDPEGTTTGPIKPGDGVTYKDRPALILKVEGSVANLVTVALDSKPDIWGYRVSHMANVKLSEVTK